MKYCTCCKTDQPKTNYHKNKAVKKDGLAAYCKDCTKVNATVYINKKEKQLTGKYQWHRKNK